MESRERGHWQHGHSGPGICIAEWKGANLAGRTCKCQGSSGDFEGQEAFAAGPRLTLGEQLRVALRGGPEGRGGSGAPHPDPRPRRSALTSSQGPQLLPAPRPRAGPEHSDSGRVNVLLSPTVTHATPSTTRSRSLPLFGFQVLKR